MDQLFGTGRRNARGQPGRALRRCAAAAAVAALFGLGGCIAAPGQPLLPPGPNPPGVQPAETPTHLQLTAIVVAGYPGRKNAVAGWDGPFSSNDADMFVSLEDGSTLLFVSNVVRNADSRSTYRFTNRYSVDWPGPMPVSLDFGRHYTIDILDDDLDFVSGVPINPFNGDDELGSFRFSPRDLYQAGQGSAFNYEVVRDGVTIRLEGVWIYR